MAIDLENRDSEPLTLTLLPVQNGTKSFEGAYRRGLACVATDLTEVNGQGFEWTVPPKTKQTHCFAVSVVAQGNEPPVCQAGLGDRIRQADLDGDAQIRRIADPLPSLKTQAPQLDNLYQRCLASLAFCRWERDDFRRKPTWVVGGFICVVTWDFSFAAHALNLIEPQAMRETIRDALDIGRMQASYIDIRKRRTMAPFLYMQNRLRCAICSTHICSSRATARS